MTIGRWSASRRSPARRGRRLQLEQLEAREVLSTVAVTVDATQVVRAVNDQLLGVNVAWWDSNLNTTKTQQMVQAAGLTMFRMPGGSSSDDFHFNAPPTYNGEGTAPSMASFIASVGGQGLVTLNYGSGSPQEAAAFLAYLNAPVGSTAAIGLGEEWSDRGNTWNNPDWQNAGYWAGLRAAKPLATDDGLNFMRLDRSAPFGFHYFEVGNEEYGSWEIDHHGQAGDPGQPHDPATYAAFAAKFASLAASIDPTIAVGVDAGGVNDYNHWLANVLSQGQSLGFVPNFVSDHSYMQAPGNENDQTLLLHTVSDPTNNNQLDWADRASGYRALLNKTLGTTAAGGVELMATEYNSVYSNPGKQTTSLVNGLFVADSIGSLLETEYDAADVWDLRNGFDTSNNNSSKLYGWRKGGDYGLLGSGGTPPATGTYVAYPTYYAEQLLSQVVHSGDIVVQATSGNTNLAVYAVREATGNLDLLVINKSATAGLTGQFQIVGFQPDTQAHVWQYGKVQDTAQSKTTDGSSALDSFTAKLALSGSSFKYTFPSYSMTVMSLSTTLPAGWSDGDVGGPGLAGYASVVGTTWTVQGGGADIGNTSDQFNFASRSLIGDGTITARIVSLTNTDPSARAGVMLRDSTDPGSAFADVVATPGDGVVFQWRSTDAAQVNQTIVSGVNAPVWVQLVRWGSSFSGYYSADGVNWTQIGTTQTLTMATTALVGLAVNANDNAALCTGTFTNVSVSPAAAASLTVAVPTDATAGTPISVTVTALDSHGNTAAYYSGTVRFRSSDPKAVLPAPHTFTAADQGTYTFQVTLKTAGARTVTVADKVNSALNVTSTPIQVSAASAASFKLRGPSSVTAGKPFNVTLTIEDAYGNTVVGYTGTVHLSSTDSQAMISIDYAFGTSDNGVHVFQGIVLKTLNSQTITAKDKSNSSIKGTITVTVNA